MSDFDFSDLSPAPPRVPIAKVVSLISASGVLGTAFPVELISLIAEFANEIPLPVWARPLLQRPTARTSDETGAIIRGLLSLIASSAPNSDILSAFRGIGSDGLELLISKMRIDEREADSVLWWQGDSANCSHFLLFGTLSVWMLRDDAYADAAATGVVADADRRVSRLPDTSETVGTLKHDGAQRFIGERALLSTDSKRLSTVVCDESSVLLTLSVDAWYNVVRHQSVSIDQSVLRNKILGLKRIDSAFRDSSESELASLSAHCTPHVLRNRQQIIQFGDPLGTVYLLIAGSVIQQIPTLKPSTAPASPLAADAKTGGGGSTGGGVQFLEIGRFETGAVLGFEFCTDSDDASSDAPAPATRFQYAVTATSDDAVMLTLPYRIFRAHISNATARVLLAGARTTLELCQLLASEQKPQLFA